MKLIKVTNRSHEYKGEVIYINIDHIESIYIEIMSSGAKRTCIDVISVKRIRVEESIEEVLEMIDKISNLKIG